MHVVVNSEAVPIEPGTTLALALNQWQMEASPGTAVAVNRRVIPREQWQSYRLEDGADIVVLKATQGG